MTLFTFDHPDGTQSTRESDRDLRWAVVVHTPKETREAIRQAVMAVDALVRDNVHRALADGTVTEREGVTYVGGIKAESREDLLRAWDEANQVWNYMDSVVYTDLYQATHWYTDTVDAWETARRLQKEYDATPWDRVVYVERVHEVEDVPF